MKFIELHKNLHKEIVNTYKLKGEDVFLIKQAISTIKSALIKDFEEFNFVKIDADKIKINELEALLSTLPIGNDYRMVVLNNPSLEAVKFINNYVFDQSTVLVCVNADKLTVGEEVDCTKLERTTIVNYILNALSKSKISIEQQALDYLIDASNNDMQKINTELNKLISYATDTGIIDIKSATNLISNTSEYVIFMLTNAIDSKNYEEYQKILNEMSKSQTMSEIFSFMGKYFRRMYYISINKNDEELVKILNIKPFAIKKARQSVTKNGIKYYINLYQKYVELDHKIKSGKITSTNAMYELVF